DTPPLLSILNDHFPHTRVEYSFPIHHWFISHLIDTSLALIPNSILIRDTLQTWFNHLPDTPASAESAYRTFLIAGPPFTDPPVDSPESLPPLPSGSALPESFRDIAAIIHQMTEYPRKLETELSTAKSGLSELEKNYRNLEESHTGVIAQNRKLETEWTRLTARYRDLETDLVRHRDALQEHQREREYLLKVRDEYEKITKQLAELESYVHTLEKDCRSKDKSLVELQAKMTDLMLKLARNDGEV
ncbi:MAG TPA: hypothetical protein PLV45_15735, partial [bacterium]|nr:hypothetical protein [bacterium]